MALSRNPEHAVHDRRSESRSTWAAVQSQRIVLYMELYFKLKFEKTRFSNNKQNVVEPWDLAS